MSSLVQTVPVVLKQRRLALGITLYRMDRRIERGRGTTQQIEGPHKNGIGTGALENYCLRGLGCPVADVIREAEAMA